MYSVLMQTLGAPWTQLIEALAALVIYLVGKKQGEKKEHQRLLGRPRGPGSTRGHDGDPDN